MKLRIFLIVCGTLIGGMLRMYCNVSLPILLLSATSSCLVLAALALPDDES